MSTGTDSPGTGTTSALRTRGERAVAAALDRLPPEPSPVRDVLAQEAAALRDTMAVAVTGMVSTGKSTLVNALLGGDLLAAGYHAVTFAPAVLRYAETVAVFGSGVPVTMADLPALTARKPDGSRPAVTSFDVRGPWPCLRWFDLVDTPGFGSVFDEDTARAMAALGLTGEDVQRLTLAELVRADAVVVVLNRANLSNDEATLLTRFHTGEDDRPPLSPITCLGVLTRVESLWSPAEPGRDPLAAGGEHTERIMAQAEAARLLFRVVPVCSKVAAASAALCDDGSKTEDAAGADDTSGRGAGPGRIAGPYSGDHHRALSGEIPDTRNDFADLVELAKAPLGTLLAGLRSPRHFADPRTDLPVPAARRAQLVERFTPYGVHLACGLLREGVGTARELRTHLEERSGIVDLRALLVGHFGRRRDLIKVARVVARIRSLDRELPRDARDRRAAENALRAVTDLGRDDHDLLELDLLTRLYDGRLHLPTALADEFRQAAGEGGASVAQRLGLAPDTALGVLAATAGQRLAACRSPSRALDPDAAPVLKALERRYELIRDRVRTARELLEDGERR